jgi:hypothetical protein
MTKHTKGPWSHTVGHISSEIVTVDGSVLYPTIALVDQTTSAATANAALIAAAPELLEAAKTISYGVLPMTPEEYGDDEFAVNATKKLRAAITKAEGE